MGWCTDRIRVVGALPPGYLYYLLFLRKSFLLAAVAYFIALPFIYLLSWLPFPVLYLISDFVYFILFVCIGYRKQVIMQNLRNSFPEKSEAEIKVICNKFCHYLCDLIVEVLKVLTISRKSMIRHCAFDEKGLAIFKKYADEGKSVIMVMGHLGNWEWAGHPFSLLCKQKLVVIYHPLTNKYFDGLMMRMRSRFGTRMIPMKTTFRDMVANRKELTATVFISDQTPMPEHAYWTTFLNQDTPIFKGTETIAKKMNLPIVYCTIKREKRGYYKMYAEVLTDNPAATAENEISEMHTRMLERDIKSQPEIWLWSHRRWKYKKPVSDVKQ